MGSRPNFWKFGRYSPMQARIQLLAKWEVVKIMENNVLLPQAANVSDSMPRKRIPQPARMSFSEYTIDSECTSWEPIARWYMGEIFDKCANGCKVDWQINSSNTYFSPRCFQLQVFASLKLQTDSKYLHASWFYGCLNSTIAGLS